MHQPPVRFTYRLLSYLISTIIAGQPLLPAVGAVITPQNGAGMDKAANGVPVVNIATPNGAGISHNRFTDYNVGKEGLILNNATGKLNPTQLGGLIQNNPNLKAGGEAKGIINEVTGGNRSLLQGYTEVAGKAANVMVANPYGITCDGCGFINTPHATLTTGRPVMNADGSLQALEVTEGSITINGAGLDGTRSDAVSIIARATEVNAALHAKDLTVTAGANRITADGRVSALKGEGDVPKVAVDTGALGGMYARRIHLTSTESGVGVNLGNLYARDGDIILSSAGKLVLKNSLAGGNTTVTGTDVSLSGDNKAGGNLSVTGTTGLTLNQPRLVTDKNLVLSSSGQIVQNGGELTAGQNAMLSAQHLNQTSGTVNAAENVTLTTTNDTTLKGRSIAGKTLTVSSGSLQALEVTEGSITINGAGLDGTRSDAVSIIARATEVNAALHAKDLTVTAGANRITADGRVSALKGEGDVPKVAVDTGALGGMYARRIHLTSTESGVGVNLGNLYAREGDITLDASGRLTVNNSLATGAVTAKGQGVTLTGDHKAGGNLSVSSRSDIVLSNGTLNSDKDLSLTAGGRITQQNEKLTAGRDVTLAAKNITQDTASQINAARDIVTVASDTLTTQGQITAGQNLTASATTLTQDGILLAKGHAGLDAGTLNNSGAVQGASLTLGSTTLSNSGSLLSGGPLTVNTRDFTQSGRTGAKGKVDITASGKLTSTGSLVSDDVLVLKAQDVTQNGVLSGGKGLTVSAQALSSGKKSVTHSDAAMTLNVTTVALDGENSAGDTLRVQADKLSTAAGAQLQSGKNLSINARDARLAGTQAAQQTMAVNASEKLTHSGKSSAPSLSLSAPELTSSGVLVGSALNTQSQTLTNSGLLQGEASLTVNTQRLDNQQNGTLYSAADLTLDIPDIRNSGLITGDNGLTLNTASLSNPGKIIADTLNVRATTLDGDGLLQGAGALALAGDTLSQGRNGRWLTAGDLSLRGKTLHTAGTTQGQNITVQADRWANSGSVLATGNLTASATGQLTSTGDIMSQGDTTLKAATMDNRGSLLSAGTLSLDGNSLDNSGTVQGNHVTIRQNSVTNSGTLTGIAALTLAARMASPQPALMNNGGSLLTSGDLTITAGSITSSGHWQGKRVLITADSLANSGAIQAADSLTARLTGELVSTAGSKVTSNGEMALSALNLSNSGQWI
ncbi:filamentous hemagglutinin N-terminal domain-containing protein, partial [Escherichia coli]|nr:filamentous hemagglutinin N-terminal domain-containing protein [Escherichia coli]